MDKFFLERMPAKALEPYHAEWALFRVRVNGELILEEDYFIDIKSFFKAMGCRESKVVFIGGCGYAACCAEGRVTRASDSCWTWNDFRENEWIEFHFDWSDVLVAACQIVEHIDGLVIWSPEYEEYHDELPGFRENLEIIKKLTNGGEFELTD